MQKGEAIPFIVKTFIWLTDLHDNLMAGDTGRIEPRVGDTVLAWLSRLHFGRFAGWPVKVLWVILGLVPPVLFVTGALMWWNRVLRPEAREVKRSVARAF